MDQESAPTGGAGWATRPFWIIIGVCLMALALGLLALTALPYLASAPSQSPAPTATSATTNAEVVDAARQWLVLGDQGRWEDGYRATGSSFRTANTAQVWASVSEQVRVPLGALISRDFLSQQYLPAPPNGFEMVKFRTRFANKAQAIETVTLEREDGGWHVVGVIIDRVRKGEHHAHPASFPFNAAASDTVALPRFAGPAWLGSGFQPDR
jgi:hypothetical protein